MQLVMAARRAVSDALFLRRGASAASTSMRGFASASDTPMPSFFKPSWLQNGSDWSAESTEVEAAVIAEPKYGLVARYLALDNRNRADTLKAEMAAVRDSFKRHDYDTGSSQVQVAALTRKIAAMTEHCQIHHQDKHSRHGLMGMLARRQRLLKFMRRTEPDAYQDVLTRLGLKDRTFVEPHRMGEQNKKQTKKSKSKRNRKK